MIRKDYFVFGSLYSRDYSLWLSGEGTEDAPQKDVDTISVPGRNGDLIVDNGRWKNLDIRYPAAITKNFAANFGALRARLAALPGYHRLEDTLHPDEYRMAAFVGPLKPETTPYNRAGEFTLVFHCKPQRFLKSGEFPIALNAPGAVHNPTAFAARPIITVYGSGAGTLTVGGCTVRIDALDESLALDCELENAYQGTENKNLTIYAPEFPTLAPGKTPVSWTGGITHLEIIPRWWTL